MRNDGVGGFFFFQAEDGIRDYKVTGVQTCALPISGQRRSEGNKSVHFRRNAGALRENDLESRWHHSQDGGRLAIESYGSSGHVRVSAIPTPPQSVTDDGHERRAGTLDRKSTRLNSSH